MPGRTPQSPDDRGTPAPAPTDSGICAISPSDLVGYTGNLINRVEQLEQRIAELEAKNVEANQLSDLAQQVGWVDGITYMGVPGWTQTSYGTLIPPAGFTLLGSGLTMSDGNQYQAVVYGEDGELIYGFGQTTSDGTFTPLVGSAATSGPFAIVYTDIIHPQAVGNFSEDGILNTGYDPSSLVTLTDATHFKVNTSGFYHLSIHCGVNGFGTQVGAAVNVHWLATGNPETYEPNAGFGPCISVRIGDTGGFAGVQTTTNSAARLMYLSSTTSNQIHAAGVGTTSTFLVNEATLGIRLLKAG